MKRRKYRIDAIHISSLSFTILLFLDYANALFPSDQLINPQNNLSPDISQSYLHWSQWQQQSLDRKFRNRSRHENLINRKPKDLPNNLDNTPFVHTTTLSTTTLPIIYDRTEQNSTPGKSNATTYLAYSLGSSVVITIATVVVSLVTICGNILVLFSFFVERALRTATNYFIASLAVTDLLIGIFSMNFYSLYLILGHWPLGRLSCDLWLSLDHTACLTSQYTVLIITIDRFFSVKIPAKYRNWRTDQKVNIMVAITWIIPSGVFFPLIMAWPYFSSTSKTRAEGECYAEFSSDPVFNTIFTICYFWVTLCVMSGLYVGIYLVAVNLQRKSDEKRGRVNTVVKSTGSYAHSQDRTAVNTGNKKLLKNAPLTDKQKPASSSSLLAHNDSSGFDSDEVHQKKNGVNSNSMNAVKPNFTILPIDMVLKEKKDKNHSNQVNPISSVNKKPEPNKPIPNDRANTIQTSVPKPIAAANRPATLKLRQECPVHCERLDSDCELSALRPPPVQFRLQQIASPILTDDESGAEGKGTRHSIVYAPSSPPLCICSDLEDESYYDQKCDSIWMNQSQNGLVISLEVEREHVQTEEKPEKDDEDFVMDEDVSRQKRTSGPPMDPEYKDRVLEMFQRRMAGKTNPTLTVNANTKSRRPLSNKHIISNVSTSTTTQASSSECTSGGVQVPNSERSPIWKPKLYPEADTYSTMCPCYGESNTLENQECALCSRQPEFDSVHSSSTDGFSAELVEKRCLCYTVGIRHVRTHRQKKTPRKFLVFIDCLSASKFRLVNALQSVIPSFKEKSNQRTERGRRENRARKALRTITFILGAFVLCWTPYHVVIMIKGICDDVETKYTCVPDVLYTLSYWLCYMNSPINPFCYALANAQFKKTFIRIFHGDFRRT